MYPFFVIGYILAGLSLTKIINLLKKYFLLVLTVSIICFFFWNRNVYPYITPSSFYAVKITTFRLLASVTTSIAFLQIMYFVYVKIMPDKINNYILVIGKETLGMYLMQGCLFCIYPFAIPFFSLIITNNMLAILTSVCIIIVLHYSIYIINKNKITAMILLGNK